MNSTPALQAFKPLDIDQRAFWNEVAANPPAWLEVPTAAELAAIADRPPTASAADYLAARRHNDRNRTDRHWQQTRPIFARLIVNRLLKGRETADPDDRLLNWIFDMVYQSSWTVSAHLPNRTLPRAGVPTLDLASCEMSALLAEAREVLLPWLNEQDETLAESMVHEIDRRILTPFAEGFEVWWDKRIPCNNWAGVCGGNILAACRSLRRQGMPRPAAEVRAVKALRHFLEHAFSPASECDEGVGYWCYGVEMACLAWSTFDVEELGRTFDMERIRQIADYPRRVHLIDNQFYSGNDSGSAYRAPLLCSSWLADAAGNPFLKQWRALVGAAPAGRFGVMLRALHHAREPLAAPTAPPLQAARYLVDQQVAIFQRRVGSRQLSMTLTGGHNAENHNHNHLGTVQLWLDAQPVIPDLGQPSYVSDFFGPHRYSYLVANSAGHCCPQINGHEQREGHEAAGRLVKYDADGGVLGLDLTSGYPAEAGLARWVRTLQVPMELPAKPIALSDEYSVAAGGEVVHRLWWTARPVEQGDGAWKVGDVTLRLHPSPASVKVTTHRAGDHRLRSFAADQELYRLEATYRGGADGALNVVSEFRVNG